MKQKSKGNRSIYVKKEKMTTEFDRLNERLGMSERKQFHLKAIENRLNALESEKTQKVEIYLDNRMEGDYSPFMVHVLIDGEIVSSCVLQIPFDIEKTLKGELFHAQKTLKVIKP